MRHYLEKFKFIKNNKVFFLLLLVQITVFHLWIFNTNILTDGDWGFFTNETLSSIRSNYFSLWMPDQNLGRVLIDVGQAPTYALHGILSKLFGFDYGTVERIVHLYPIVFGGLISIYLFLKLLVKNNLGIFIGCCLYLYNTYALILTTGHITLAGAYAFAPLCLYFAIKLLDTDKPSVPGIIKLALSLFLVACYEPRVCLIVISILGLYFLFHLVFYSKKRLPQFFNFVLSLIIFVMFNFYWILGLAKTNLKGSVGILERGLFGNNFFDLTHAITLHHPFWNGTEPIAFLYNQVPIIFWTIPCIVILGLYLNRKHKIALFFGVLMLIGVLLSKQVDEPFQLLYPWLFENFPGFSAFREASKFYLLVALSYSVLVGFLFRKITDFKLNPLLILSAMGIAIVPLVSNMLPFVRGDIGSTFEAKEIPEDYQIYNEFLMNDKNYSRTLWVPIESRYATYTQLHPKVNSVGLYNSILRSYRKLDPLEPFHKKAQNLFDQNYSDSLLDSMSVKYIVQPIRDIKNKDDFYQYYGNNREQFTNILKNNNSVREIDIGTEELKVYENENFLPYISTSNTLHSISSFKELSNYHSFLSSNISETNLAYILEDESKYNEQINNIVDLGAKINNKIVSNSDTNIKFKLPDTKANILYWNPANNRYSYQVINNTLNFITEESDMLEINDYPLEKQATNPLPEIKLDSDKGYGFNIGQDFYIIDTMDNRKRNIGIIQEKSQVFQFGNENLVNNGSFENLGNIVAEDCNKFDEKSIITANIISDSNEGNQALELQGVNNFSCYTTNLIQVLPGDTLNLKFDYKIIEGGTTGYDIVLNGDETNFISYDFIKPGNEWLTLSNLIVVPTNTYTIQIRFKGFPDYLTNKSPKNLYDNISLKKVLPIANIINTADGQFKHLDLNKTQYLELAIPSKSHDTENLIKNHSFEDGLWQEIVGDCNNYDNKADLSMELSDLSSEGNASLELRARTHIACTQTSAINVQEGETYSLTFDYQSPNSKTGGFYLRFNDPSRTTYSDRFQIPNTEWNKYNTDVNVPIGATSAALFLYSYGDDYGIIEYINRYDNFVLKESLNLEGKYYLYSKPLEEIIIPREAVYFTEHSTPTKKYVSIMNASTPFYLNMSETYHPQWRLELNDSKVSGNLNSWLPFINPNAVDTNRHYKLNDFMNTWYVDPEELCNSGSEACTKNEDGSYNISMLIEFTPQRYLYLGLIISGVFLLTSIIYLIDHEYLKRKVIKIETI